MADSFPKKDESQDFYFCNDTSFNQKNEYANQNDATYQGPNKKNQTNIPQNQSFAGTNYLNQYPNINYDCQNYQVGDLNEQNQQLNTLFYLFESEDTNIASKNIGKQNQNKQIKDNNDQNYQKNLGSNPDVCENQINTFTQQQNQIQNCPGNMMGDHNLNGPNTFRNCNCELISDQNLKQQEGCQLKNNGGCKCTININQHQITNQQQKKGNHKKQQKYLTNEQIYNMNSIVKSAIQRQEVLNIDELNEEQKQNIRKSLENYYFQVSKHSIPETDQFWCFCTRNYKQKQKLKKHIKDEHKLIPELWLWNIQYNQNQIV